MGSEEEQELFRVLDKSLEEKAESRLNMVGLIAVELAWAHISPIN